MNTIELQQTLPAVFAGRDSIISDVWHQSLTLKRGEAYLVEAASGTGKSSLCSYVYGYRNDYQGIINFDERNIRSLSVNDWTDIRKHSLSILFQELRIFPELTAIENIQLKNRLTNFKKRSPYPIRGNRHCRQGKRKSREAIFRPATKSRLYPQPLPAFRLHLPGRGHERLGRQQRAGDHGAVARLLQRTDGGGRGASAKHGT